MRYKASDEFWKNFHRLSSAEKALVRRAWIIFKVDPFDRRLGTHKIHILSAKAKRTIYSVVVDADLRVLFYVENDTVFTVDVGSHDVYKV
jgi:hypothetical protein